MCSVQGVVRGTIRVKPPCSPFFVRPEIDDFGVTAVPDLVVGSFEAEAIFVDTQHPMRRILRMGSWGPVLGARRGPEIVRGRLSLGRFGGVPGEGRPCTAFAHGCVPIWTCRQVVVRVPAHIGADLAEKQNT